jgi:hypothetical protein
MEEKIVLLIVGILTTAVLTMAELMITILTTTVPMIEVLLILIFINMETMEFKAGASLVSTIKVVDVKLAKDEFGMFAHKVNINFVGELPALNFDKGEVVIKDDHIQIAQAMFNQWLNAIENDEFFELDYLLADADEGKRLASLGKALKGATLTIENTILDCSAADAAQPFYMQRVLKKAVLDDKLIKNIIRIELMRQK